MNIEWLNKMNKEKLLKRLIFIGLLFLIVIIFSQKIRLTMVDLGRHIENGKVVWQHSDVLFDNFYSYTRDNYQFINHHWFSGVIYYIFYLIGGFKLLSVLNILLILGAFSLAFSLSRKKIGFYFTSLLSLPVVFLLSERVEIRPEIFSYLFFFLTWFIIEKVEEDKKYKLLWWLLPLFFFWANIHIYFFLGLALIGFKIFDKFLPVFIKKRGNIKEKIISAWRVSKIWVIRFIQLIIISLFNPNAIKGLLYPFNILKNYGYEIAENKSIFYLQNLMPNYNFFLFKLLLFLLILSWIAYFLFRKKIKWFELLISILFSFLALLFSRNLAIFSLVALVIISGNLIPVCLELKNIKIFKRLKQNKYYFNFIIVGLLLIISFSMIFLLFDYRKSNNFLSGSFGWGLDRGMNDSMEFFKENNLSGPIFNNYDIGSALIFWLYPEEKVFVDNRPEAYGEEFFSTIYRPMQSNFLDWHKYSEEYNINLIYFSHTDSTPWARSFLLQRFSDPNWDLLYFDPYVVIMMKDTDKNRDKIKELGIDSVEFRKIFRKLVLVSNRRNKFNLASLANLSHNSDLAEEVYKQILFNDPDNSRALYSLSLIYSSKGLLFRSLEYLNKTISSGYRLPAIYNDKASVYWRLGDYKLAEINWKKALRLNRRDKTALNYLEQIRELKLNGKLPK